MRNLKSIIFQPILLGLLLSVGVHAVVLNRQGKTEPAQPLIKKGRTVIQLSLQPKPAPAAIQPQPEPPPKKETPRPPEPKPEPAPPVIKPTPEPKPKPEIKQPDPETTKPETYTKPSKPAPLPLPPVAPQPPVERSPARPPETTGIITEAELLGTFEPDYPDFSRRKGEEGSILLQLQILADGSVGDAKILSSSGSKRLDKAALNAVKTCRYSPARNDGRPIESTVPLRYTFRLENE